MTTTANQENFTQTSLFDRRFARLLELFQGVNRQIESCDKRGDILGVRQYNHLKKQYVNDLIELLEEMKVSVQAKEVETKETEMKAAA